MSKRSLYILAISLLLLGCATEGSGFSTGENLIQPLPFPGNGWVAYGKVDGSVEQYRWISSEENGQVDTSVAKGARRDLAGYLEFDVNLARSKCSAVEREVVAEAPANGYLSATWHTRCELGEGRIRSILQKAIQGQDSFYLVKRIWPDPPTRADYTAWREYLETVVVCDTRRPGSCPEGYEPGRNLATPG